MATTYITGQILLAADLTAGFAAKLDKAGGTLTGALTGTSAAFSGAVSGASGAFSGAVSGATGVLTGTLTVGNNTAVNPFVILNGTGQVGVRSFVAGAERWREIVSNAEGGGGSNTGSDRLIQKFTDAGVSSTLTSWTRSSGLFTHNAQGLFHYTNTDNINNPSALVGWLNQTSGFGGKVGGILQVSNLGYVYTPFPAWAAGVTHAIGDVVAVGANLMTATSAGVSGGVTPTCSPLVPSSSDGGVLWAFFKVVGVSQQLVGGFTSAAMTDSFGGTSTGRQGTVFGFNTQAAVSVATGLAVVGYENNFGAAFPVYNRIGEQIIVGVAGTQAGSQDDVGWRITTQRDGSGGGGAPLKHLMGWGSRTGGAFLDPNGYGLRCWASGWSEPGGVILTPGAGAIDLTEFNASGSGYFGGGFILRGPGSKILGSGDIQSTSALIHGTATGATIDANQFQVTAAAIHAGAAGTNWNAPGSFAYCTDGSIVKVTAVAGGAVTAISLVYGAYSSAAPGTVTASPEHYVGVPDDAGNPLLPSTFQVDLTASLANTGSPILTLGGTASVSVASTLAVTGATTSASYKVGANQVVAARDTGWTAMTGTPDKSTAFATSTVTLAQLAGRVMAMQTALTTHGLMGA